MKAVLYAVVDDNCMSWFVSLDIRADFTYWFGQQRNPFRILMLDPSISFGQALHLRDRFDKVASRRVPYRELMQQLQSEVKNMYATQASQDSGSTRAKLQLLECGREQADAYLRTYAPGLSFLKEDELKQLALFMQGRSLLLEEIHQLVTEHQLKHIEAHPLYYLQMGTLRALWQTHQGIQKKTASKLFFWNKSSSYVCHRCGGGSSHMVMTECMFCGTTCPYCEQCLTMGRSRYCSVTVSAPVGQFVPRKDQDVKVITEGNDALQTYIEPWGLSEIQAEASGQALQFMKGIELHKRQIVSKLNHQFLIWAVTGAGKTEMIFPMIHYMIDRGGKVVITTPRRDVVLELKPRIEKAFSSTSVVTLYGGSSERWSSGEITIATTHQLMRFEQAFDLVIIDELDAFPYHNNPMLEYAASKVCKPGGMTILLSATPPRHLQKAAKRGQLPHVKVTARYHRHPLPVPALLLMPPLKKQLQRGAIDGRIAIIIRTSIDRGAQLFVFVPKIHMVEPLTKLFGQMFPDVLTRGTSSKDDQRAQKVTDFRSKETRILVTTTILERGVTIPKSDVLILDADEPIFDSAALVQMSGRAGRSADDPAGNVYFAAKEKTRAQVEAIGQIKEMNRLARKKGYLIDKGR